MRYEAVVLADPEFCSRQNVEQMLWKAAFYQLIEALRRVMSDDPSYVDDAKNKLLKVIEEVSFDFFFKQTYFKPVLVDGFCANWIFTMACRL